jgi:hypothetical protein
MGSNLAYKGIKEVLEGMGIKSDISEPSVKEVNSEWRRLASTMKGIS